MRRVIGLGVSMSVLVFIAGLEPAKSDPVRLATVPPAHPTVEWLSDLDESPSPFAYVHEDGSLEYVPARGRE